MLRFSLGMTWTEMIRNEHIRVSAKVESFRERQVQRRDGVYVGHPIHVED